MRTGPRCEVLEGVYVDWGFSLGGCKGGKVLEGCVVMSVDAIMRDLFHEM